MAIKTNITEPQEQDDIYNDSDIGSQDDDLHFTIKKVQGVLVCPDGTEKEFVCTGHFGDDETLEEHYAEWNDIGIFYYPRGREEGETDPTFWIQGCAPTYPGGPEFTEADDGIFVRIE